MHNGNCVKNEPIEINVYCEVTEEEPSDPVVNWCNGPARIRTNYSVDKKVPVDFFIEEWIDYSYGPNTNSCEYNHWGMNDITIAENTMIPVREDNDYIETVREDTVWYTSLMRFGWYRLTNWSVGLSLDINEHGKTTIEVNGQKYEINKHECTKSTKYRASKMPPIEIKVTCHTQYDDRQWTQSQSCPQNRWLGTTYTADTPLPTKVLIGQTKYMYGINQWNWCTRCYHHEDTATSYYTIKAWFTSSTQGPGTEWVATTNNHFYADKWYDGEFMNGYSSFADLADEIGEITDPKYEISYTSSTGQEYIIKLIDCENKYRTWRSWVSSSNIVPLWQTCRWWSSGWWGSSGWWSSGWWSTQTKNITLNNDTQRVIRLYNNATYPFHFNDTSYNEDNSCVGSTQACDLYLWPWWHDFTINYEYCNQNSTFSAQSCRATDVACGTLYPVNIDCSTKTISFGQSSATSSS